MSLERVSHDDDVIQINQADILGQPGENQIHQPLEQRRRVGQTETEYLVTKVVLSADSGSIATCQYPDRRSRLLKNFDPPNELRPVSILGKGYESL